MYGKWVKTHVFSSFTGKACMRVGFARPDLHEFDEFSNDAISKNDVNLQGNTNMMFLLLKMGCISNYFYIFLYYTV